MQLLPDIHFAGVIASLLLIVGVSGLRFLMIKTILRGPENVTMDQRRWVARVKTMALVVTMIGLVLIWAPQLQTLALSLTAVAVALVVATKEIILCLTGALLRVTSHSFRMGDWISVDGVTGEVTEANAFTFRLQEIDIKDRSYQFTGQTIEIPNSKFFTNNVENLTFMKSYVFLDVPVTVPAPELDMVRLLPALQRIAQEAYRPYAEAAPIFMEKVERKSGIDMAQPGPQIMFRTTDLGHGIFTVRMFVPTRKAGEVSEAISTHFLSFVYAQREKREDQKNAKQKGNG